MTNLDNLYCVIWALAAAKVITVREATDAEALLKMAAADQVWRLPLMLTVLKRKAIEENDNPAS